MAQSLCTAHHAAAYDYEPEMGDELASFSQGDCDACPESGTVWTVREEHADSEVLLSEVGRA